jgi:lysyl-tRNA synthetase class 2
MSNWEPNAFKKRLPYLEVRMKLIKSVRQFFDHQKFYEVQTPVLQTSPGMDTHIHAFKTELKDIDLSLKDALYLHTSPEFAMKKLLVAGLPKIFQICPVFRNAEGSKLHNPEFTMIEWYRSEADYKDIMNDCTDLLRHIAKTLEIRSYKYKDYECDPYIKWQKISVKEAFKEYAEIDLDECLNNTDLFKEKVKELKIHTASDDRWDDLFFRIMAEKIEPYLGMKAPCILYDYPASMAALSKKKSDNPNYAERFELFICGIEIANAFSELTDAKEQLERFENEMKIKYELYLEKYPIDYDFIKALEKGMPESGGVALGVDRLVMLACGCSDISEVLW